MATIERKLVNIDRSIDCHKLWPPIADALGTFQRRRSAGADNYELAWRLIHVWESIACLLSGAITTRLRSMGPEVASSYLRCREHLFGKKWHFASQTFSEFEGALSGSAFQRIEILSAAEPDHVSKSRFLQSVSTFLDSGTVDVAPLVSSWQQICEIPHEARGAGRVKIRLAFRLINMFRNKFAHVPFPTDEVGHIYRALADITDQLFAIEPLPHTVYPDERVENPLIGAISYRSSKLSGSIPPQESPFETNEPHFTFPPATKKPQEFVEHWDATPFIFVDSMFRPSVLTRLTMASSEGIWEYTRYLAERNSAFNDRSRTRLAKLISPIREDYVTAADTEEEEALSGQLTAASGSDIASLTSQDAISPKEGFSNALRSIANEDYDAAISYFEKAIALNPTYHIAWLRLGYALREKAMRVRFDHPEEAGPLFERSVEALTKAAQHRQATWQAQALYERSKARYHRRAFLLHEDGPNNEVQQAEADASEAYRLNAEPKYQSWIEYLLQRVRHEYEEKPIPLSPGPLMTDASSV